MNHFLAYGNSDQQSFRAEDVRATLDFVTVPGTIAAYYPSATAGFVLSLGLPYIIEPRTPLFQEHIDHPRASHKALAQWLGGPVLEQLGGDINALPANADFPPEFYSDDVLDSLVDSLIAHQAGYGHRAAEEEEVFARYQALLVEALPEDAQLPSPEDAPPPKFTLAPYFAARSESDPWTAVNQRIWERCALHNRAGEISLVAAVTTPVYLNDALEGAPSSLANSAFFWVTGFEERRSSEADLALVAAAVREQSQSKQLINLYGGFFSICLGGLGLWGFNNGLGYSEYRNWPELATTGAAPPRYYLRTMHQFVTPAAAEVLMEVDPIYLCDCAACAPRGVRVAGMNPRELKRHFALSRAWEIELVSEMQVDELAQALTAEGDRFNRAVRPQLPTGMSIQVDYLYRWARVLVGQ